MQEVKDKLEATNDWKATQRDHSLHELISKIERICVGFNDHKQEVFNLVQVLKTLFLYSQSNKETMEEYGRNFCSLWDTMEAFRGLPGMHKGITDGMLKDPNHVADMNRPTDEERSKAEEDGSEAVKAALLISGANKQWYGWLKNKLANNYLLGTDQYPSTFNKALCILGSYQVSTSNRPFQMPGNESGLAFIQRGGQGQGRGGRGRGAGGGAGTTEANTGSGRGNVSAMTGGLGERQAPRINQAGDLNCYNCSATDHWADECPELTSEQQAQLNMVVETGEKTEEQHEGHQLLNASFLQGETLPDNRVYLDGCSTVTTFKMDKYLKDMRPVPGGININCNAETMNK